MKRTIQHLAFGKSPTLNLLIAAAVLLVVSLGCGSSKPAPPEYVGSWTGADGATMTIRADGKADYKSGSSSVDNGSVTIDDSAKTLKIGFAGVGPTFTIDKAPTGSQMTLSGVVYRKSGGGSDPKSDNSKAEVPSGEKLQTLVKSTFMDFSDGVQSGDFSDFHNKVAKVWQDQSTPDEMLDAFQVFVDDKANYNFKRAIATLDATFTPAPAIEQQSGQDVLVAKGYYPTKPLRANFELKYIMEDGTWKLIGIDIKTKRE